MKKLTILFDDKCEFCWGCRGWMQEQAAFLELEFIPCRSNEAQTRFPGLVPPTTGKSETCSVDKSSELVVVSDEGGVYRGPNAFIMCLYALEEFREYSEWLSRPLLRPLARRAFEMLSRNRWIINQWFYAGGEAHLAEQLKDNHACAEVLSSAPSARRT